MNVLFIYELYSVRTLLSFYHHLAIATLPPNVQGQYHLNTYMESCRLLQFLFIICLFAYEILLLFLLFQDICLFADEILLLLLLFQGLILFLILVVLFLFLLSFCSILNSRSLLGCLVFCIHIDFDSLSIYIYLLMRYITIYDQLPYYIMKFNRNSQYQIT